MILTIFLWASNFVSSNPDKVHLFQEGPPRVYYTKSDPPIVSIAPDESSAQHCTDTLKKYRDNYTFFKESQETKEFIIFGAEPINQGWGLTYIRRDSPEYIRWSYLELQADRWENIHDLENTLSDLTNRYEDVIKAINQKSSKRHKPEPSRLGKKEESISRNPTPRKRRSRGSPSGTVDPRFRQEAAAAKPSSCCGIILPTRQDRRDKVTAAINSGTPIPTTKKFTAPLIKNPSTNEQHTIQIVKQKTHEALYAVKKGNPNLKVGILNLANRRTPGGGFIKYGKAQEEDLCDEASTLYLSLASSGCYPFGPAEVLYTPDVQFGDYKADVISAALPHFKRCVYEDDEFKGTDYELPKGLTPPDTLEEKTNYGKLLLDTVQHILLAGQNCDVLILGAIGCGAFGNDPTPVATAFKKIAAEQGLFGNKQIIFAIYSNGRHRDEKNLKVFQNILTTQHWPSI